MSTKISKIKFWRAKDVYRCYIRWSMDLCWQVRTIHGIGTPVIVTVRVCTFFRDPMRITMTVTTKNDINNGPLHISMAMVRPREEIRCTLNPDDDDDEGGQRLTWRYIYYYDYYAHIYPVCVTCRYLPAALARVCVCVMLASRL